MSVADRRDDRMEKGRRGRRLELSCRLFFFGDDGFEGEGFVLDVSTHGCRDSTTFEVHPGMILKLSFFLSDHKWPIRALTSR